jgi:hypothetical protein
MQQRLTGKEGDSSRVGEMLQEIGHLRDPGYISYPRDGRAKPPERIHEAPILVSFVACDAEGAPRACAIEA